MQNELTYNYAYYPVVFKTEQELHKVEESLHLNKINGRRYFYPSLNELPFLSYQPCPISEDISRRVLCLPLYVGLDNDDINQVILSIIKILVS